MYFNVEKFGFHNIISFLNKEGLEGNLRVYCCSRSDPICPSFFFFCIQSARYSWDSSHNWNFYYGLFIRTVINNWYGRIFFFFLIISFTQLRLKKSNFKNYPSVYYSVKSIHSSLAIPKNAVTMKYNEPQDFYETDPHGSRTLCTYTIPGKPSISYF